MPDLHVPPPPNEPSRTGRRPTTPEALRSAGSASRPRPGRGGPRRHGPRDGARPAVGNREDLREEPGCRWTPEVRGFRGNPTIFSLDGAGGGTGGSPAAGEQPQCPGRGLLVLPRGPAYRPPGPVRRSVGRGDDRADQLDHHHVILGKPGQHPRRSAGINWRMMCHRAMPSTTRLIDGTTRPAIACPCRSLAGNAKVGHYAWNSW